jgi:hypothetical protein
MTSHRILPAAWFVAALFVAAALVPALAPAPAAATCASPALNGIRPLGMGNAFLAVADDRNTLYYNPAGLANLSGWRISGLGIGGGLDNEFLDLVRFIQDHEDEFSDFDEIDQDFYDTLAPYDDRWVAAEADAYFDATGPRVGVGLYSVARLQFKIDRGVYEPRVYGSVADDIVGVVGAAMPLGRQNLTIGGSVKAIWRRESTRALTAREVADFDPDEILDDLDMAVSGFALDLGVLWQQPGSRFTAGAVLRDGGFVGGEALDSGIGLGVSWQALTGPAGPVRGVLLATDVRDIFGGGDQALGNRIHLGAEIGLPVVSVRTGFNQGYPTVGASLGLRVLHLDYAFYGRELGNVPGSESQFLHAVEMRLGF